MTFTYKFTDASETMLARENPDGSITYIRANSGSRGWQEYVESGAEAAPYVAPPEPEPLTTEEKVNQLLSDYGLSRNELKAALAEDVAENTAEVAPKTRRKR